MALFGYYSHGFYSNPLFTTSASVSYITYGSDTPEYTLPTNRTTMAVWIGGYNPESYLRVRFY